MRIRLVPSCASALLSNSKLFMNIKRKNKNLFLNKIWLTFKLKEHFKDRKEFSKTLRSCWQKKLARELDTGRRLVWGSKHQRTPSKEHTLTRSAPSLEELASEERSSSMWNWSVYDKLIGVLLSQTK